MTYSDKCVPLDKRPSRRTGFIRIHQNLCLERVFSVHIGLSPLCVEARRLKLSYIYVCCEINVIILNGWSLLECCIWKVRGWSQKIE